MFASVINWSVQPPLHNAGDRDRLMRELVSSSIGTSRQVGVVDIIMIEAEPDLIMGVSLFETLDEAFSAGAAELVQIARLFSDRLQLVSRVVGSSHDLPSFNLIDRSEAQQWRNEADAMFANVATWRIDPSLRAPANLAEFLSDAMTTCLPHLRQQGLIDMQVIRVADDVILVVHLFAGPVGASKAYDEAIAATHDCLGGMVELVKGHAGRAFDVPQLLGARV